jgi:prepilin-type N-terminal cleavage/methylation domain-containing protein
MKARAGGFTLMEMLVVLAIIGCVAAATPALNHSLLDRVRLTFAVRSVAARIQKAEMLASAGGSPVSLAGPALSRGLLAAVELEALNGSATLPNIWVYPDGSASPARIVMQAGRRRAVLTLNALDGRLDEPD